MLAFIAAEAREFAGVLRHAKDVAKLDWPMDFARSATLNGRDVVLLANGPGPRLAARAAEIAKEHIDLQGLISVGFCGALDPSLKPADIIVARQVCGGPTNVTHALTVPRSQSSERKLGKLLSTDHVATTSEEKRMLHRETGSDAIEMEAAALAAKATEWQIPCFAVKAVSDMSCESLPLDFNRLRDAEGRFSRGKIILAALRRPSLFPSLLHLNRRCNLAAEALGDFLARSSF
ncbi:MAG TPA: hypothetical protein VKX49_01575 [Bryobacteraceae bacterium]|nr:hypothetical protein [Bryobacteraceae bacterium]